MSLCLSRFVRFTRVLKSFSSLRNFPVPSRDICHATFVPLLCSKRYKSGKGSVASVLTVTTAKDLIAQLSPKERQLLLEEVQKFQALAAKDEPSPPPSFAQLKAVLAHNALPFIGFGFLDNFIMILAGDYIDTTIGLTFGISTMAAAALGNTISDIAGIGSAWYVESFAVHLGVHPPVLTPAQIDMYRTRWSAHLGRALGITIGCIIGMIPLLFLSEKTAPNEDKEEDAASS